MSDPKSPDDALIMLSGLDEVYAYVALMVAGAVLVMSVAIGLSAIVIVARRAWRRRATSQAAFVTAICFGLVCGFVAAWMLVTSVISVFGLSFDNDTITMHVARLLALAAMFGSAWVIDIVRRGNAAALAGSSPSSLKPRLNAIFVIAVLELVAGVVVFGALHVLRRIA